MTDFTNDVEHHEYLGCDAGGDVSPMFFEKGGHTVSGYNTAWGPGQGTSDFNGFQVAWDLMKGYPLND